MQSGITDRDTGGRTAYVCLGANLEDASETLERAGAALAELLDVRDIVLSRVFLTEPQGYAEQPLFHNQAAALSCARELTPETLLDRLLDLETALGRVRGGPKNGPRRIDLDLLLMDGERRRSARLTLPHPRMLDRAFVLVPLAEIAPDLMLPQGMTVRDALARLDFSVRDGVIYQSSGTGL